MRVFFRILLIAFMTLPFMGCPGDIGSQNKNQDPNAPLVEHDEDEAPADDPPA